MKLWKVLLGIDYRLISGELDTEINNIICDSREEVSGGAFICIQGYHGDGHEYIQEIAAKGARAVIIENQSMVPQKLLQSLTVILVEDTKEVLAEMAANFYHNPAAKMITVGITGTKGKTTVVSMIRKILIADHKRVGTIGTLGVWMPDDLEPVGIQNTTPGALEIQRYLSKMVEAGCQYVVMEVSSQGLKDKRVHGILFDYGIFTNIALDHIGPNEHKDFAEYLECKSRLFKQCRFGIINFDDRHFYDIIKGAACVIYTYGFSNGADLVGTMIEETGYQKREMLACDTQLAEKATERCNEHITSFETSGIEEERYEMKAVGAFSVYNGMSAILFSKLQGIPKPTVKEALKDFIVKGRMETVKVSDDFTVMIDYAHNANSMENVLRSVRPYAKGRVISMFGCGGNRSRTRRFEMGEISGSLADLSIITEDNSRWESPFDIINDILTGMKKTKGEYLVIPNRKDAIKYCLEHARRGDIVLFLGKGHEIYQEIKGQKYEFDERKILKEMMEELKEDGV